MFIVGGVLLVSAPELPGRQNSGWLKQKSGWGGSG